MKKTPSIMDMPPEKIDKMDSYEFYAKFRNDINNFSYWYPKVQHCGIRVPKSVVISVPDDLMDAFYLDHPDKDIPTIEEWVKNSVLPVIPDTLDAIFVKNGTFSNKFHFSSCTPNTDLRSLTQAIIEIQEASLCFETGGNSEIVIRERIPEEEGLCHIYHGMPLRPEFRVFYDFDVHRPLYVVNYWDRDYCHRHIARIPEDAEQYDKAYPKIKDFFKAHADIVLQAVHEHMKDVTGLEGIWSIDIMFANHEYYLIDMAIGYRSAYYDAQRIKSLAYKE